MLIKQGGGTGERGEKIYLMVIGPLSAWFDPESELVDFRDHVLIMASKLQQKQWLPLHWAILSAAYPFGLMFHANWSSAEPARANYTAPDIQSA